MLAYGYVHGSSRIDFCQTAPYAWSEIFVPEFVVWIDACFWLCPWLLEKEIKKEYLNGMEKK